MKHRKLYLSIASISTALLALTICVLPLAAAQNKQYPDKEASPPSNHATTPDNATISPATPQTGDDEAAEKPRNGIAPTVKPVDTEPIKEETAPDK